MPNAACTAEPFTPFEPFGKPEIEISMAEKDTLQPSPNYSPEDVVKLQLKALKQNDAKNSGIRIAYRFSSPENKTAIGTVENFMRLVKNPLYAPMLNYDTDELGAAIVRGDSARQKVILIGSDGKAAKYEFYLSRQTAGKLKGCWLTDGVTREDGRQKPLPLREELQGELSDLFERLTTTTSAVELRLTELMIWEIWMESGDDTVNALMLKGCEAMEREDYSAALSAFDKITALMPDYAEGWNKRATVNFLLGNFIDSMSDIELTLKLEPRHFGAISGLGIIYSAQGNDTAALAVYEKLLEIHPHQPAAKAKVVELKRKLGGKKI